MADNETQHSNEQADPDTSEGQGTDPINPQLNTTSKVPRTESETSGPIGSGERITQVLKLP